MISDPDTWKYRFSDPHQEYTRQENIDFRLRLPEIAKDAILSIRHSDLKPVTPADTYSKVMAKDEISALDETPKPVTPQNLKIFVNNYDKRRSPNKGQWEVVNSLMEELKRKDRVLLYMHNNGAADPAAPWVLVLSHPTLLKWASLNSKVFIADGDCYLYAYLHLFIITLTQALNARSLRTSKDPAHSGIWRERDTFRGKICGTCSLRIF